MNAAGGFACVLDASALLALLQEEPGAEVVEQELEASAISAVNWSEIVHKGLGRGVQAGGLREDLGFLGLTIASFTVGDAEVAAALRESTVGLGLSLADRACLAFGPRLGTKVFTTDRAWTGVDVVPVRVIR